MLKIIRTPHMNTISTITGTRSMARIRRIGFEILKVIQISVAFDQVSSQVDKWLYDRNEQLVVSELDRKIDLLFTEVTS